jgi:SAM-dependent methyltransferase
LRSLVYLTATAVGWIDLARVAPIRREQILRAFNEQRQNLWMEQSDYIEDKRRSIDFHYRTCNFDVVDHSSPILDIGCGTGVALNLFHERGWTRCYGLEPDLYSIRQMAQRRPFITAFWADIYSSETARFTDFFGLVMLDNVLEHHTEPHLSIDICARMLAPGGCLWIAVPNSHGGTLAKLGSSYGNMNFGHWSFFSAQSLALLLSRQFKTAMLYDSQRQCHLELCELPAHADQLASFTEDWVQALAVLQP